MLTILRPERTPLYEAAFAYRKIAEEWLARDAHDAVQTKQLADRVMTAGVALVALINPADQTAREAYWGIARQVWHGLEAAGADDLTFPQTRQYVEDNPGAWREIYGDVDAHLGPLTVPRETLISSGSAQA